MKICILVLLITFVVLCINAASQKIGGNFAKKTVSDDKVAQQYWLSLARDTALLMRERVDVEQYAPHQRKMAQEINDNIDIVWHFMNELEIYEMKAMSFDTMDVTAEEYRARLDAYRTRIELMREQIVAIINMVKSQKAFIAKMGGFSFAQLFSRKSKNKPISTSTPAPIPTPTPLAECGKYIDNLVLLIAKFKQVSHELRSSKIIRRSLSPRPNAPQSLLPVTVGIENDTRTSSLPLSEKESSEYGRAIAW